MLQPKNQIPEGLQGRIRQRQRAAPAELRPVRPEGDGAGAHHRAPDRGAARRAIAPHEARRPRLDPHFPDVPVSKKPTEVRMGKGQGRAGILGARVSPGRIMFEIDGVPETSREALTPGAAKLPIRDALHRAHRRIRGRPMKSKQRTGDLKGHDRRPAQRDLLKLKKEQFNLRFQRAPASSRKTRVRVVRRDIAASRPVAAEKAAGKEIKVNHAEAHSAGASWSATRTGKTSWS